MRLFQNAKCLDAIVTKPFSMMVMLHGIGSHGGDLISLAPYFRDHFNDMVFISPNGIEDYDNNGPGYQWFSMKSVSGSDLVSELDRVGPLILDAIKDKAEEYEIPLKNVLLTGFSQGAMLAIHLASMERFGSILAFSGAAIPTKNCINNQTPICMIHGADDDVLRSDYMVSAKSFLEKNGFVVETNLFRHLRHSIDYRGVESAIRFLKQHFAKV